MNGLSGVIFDIDGVLMFQGKIIPGAIATIDKLREIGLTLCYLTNSTLKSRSSCGAKLRKAGFKINDEEVITASYATSVYLRSLNPKSCWVMVDGEGGDEFQDFAQDFDHPEYLVVGDNRSRFDFEHLNKALRCLIQGSKLIAMQSELLDTSLGDIELNVGSWVGLLERASGVKAVSIGKPCAYAFELALKTMRLEKEEVIVVGDRVSTDIHGALNYGLRSALVKTGEFDLRDLNGDIQPDFMFHSVQDLLGLFD